MWRIGFLFNHQAPHQVLHTAPVAFELGRRSDTEVTILATREIELNMARRIGRHWPGHRVTFQWAAGTGTRRWLERHRLPCRLPGKKGVLRANRRVFAQLDALVVPERTSTRLRSYPELSHLQLIQIPHGAGDRAVGYEPRNAHFDLLLLAGEKCRERMIGQLGLEPHRLEVIGYPKFDVPSLCAARLSLPADRPTVLYNPHFDRHLSSWYLWGERVLDWFATQSRYNLIFAPHVLLSLRRFGAAARLLRRYRDLPHLLIDTGSDHCVDMTYTRLADVYLGDVSSQIYEYLHLGPRPAVFLNARGISEWRSSPDYRHWHLGRVVDRLTELPAALAQPLTSDEQARQRQAVASTFERHPQAASARGADAIIAHLTRRAEGHEVAGTPEFRAGQFHRQPQRDSSWIPAA